MEPCRHASSCSIANLAGVIWSMAKDSADVIMDSACKDGKHLIKVDPNALVVAGYRIIFSFHDIPGGSKCDSIGCIWPAHYTIYNFLMNAKFTMCATHTIEWFNQQYRLLADVVEQQKKQFNLLKYSVPLELPGDDKR
jgi:hypothetical protein